MARDEFIRDVRRVMLDRTPRVDIDHPFRDAVCIEKLLRRGSQWVSGRTVDAFDPADFAELDSQTQDALVHAVEDFRQVASRVDPRQPVPPDRHQAAVEPFVRVVQIVQDLVFQDWLQASSDLLADAEQWASEEGWPTKRFPREVMEDFIGRYSLDRLIYAADGAQLALVPLGRFAPGTDGMFDLAVMPEYDSLMVVRERGRWFIHSLPGQEARDLWSREAFVQRSHDLAHLT